MYPTHHEHHAHQNNVLGRPGLQEICAISDREDVAQLFSTVERMTLSFGWTWRKCESFGFLGLQRSHPPLQHGANVLNRYHFEFQSADQEIQRIAAAGSSYLSGTAVRDSMRQEIWQSWWNDYRQQVECLVIWDPRQRLRDIVAKLCQFLPICQSERAHFQRLLTRAHSKFSCLVQDGDSSLRLRKSHSKS